MERRQAKAIAVGKTMIGGGNPIVVQSMTTTDTTDTAATLGQIRRLAAAGCQLVRVAVPDRESAIALKEIKRKSPLPLVADIHFDFNLALAALEVGVDKLRINPGTMSAKALKTIAAAAQAREVPIRIGVNSGSIHSAFRHQSPTEALVNSALAYCHQMEDLGYTSLVVSLKSSSVTQTYWATEQFAAASDYPLHLGITEAGTLQTSTIKSSIGIGALLLRGIGDTMRVSVTGPPETEIPIAEGILRALGLKTGAEVISCPTCARSGYDVLRAAQEVETHLSKINLPLKVAVMGCSVNGPGEARQADYGIAFGPTGGVLFAKGEVVKKLPNEELIGALINLIDTSTEGRFEV